MKMAKKAKLATKKRKAKKDALGRKDLDRAVGGCGEKTFPFGDEPAVRRPGKNAPVPY